MQEFRLAIVRWNFLTPQHRTVLLYGVYIKPWTSIESVVKRNVRPSWPVWFYMLANFLLCLLYLQDINWDISWTVNCIFDISETGTSYYFFLSDLGHIMENISPLIVDPHKRPSMGLIITIIKRIMFSHFFISIFLYQSTLSDKSDKCGIVTAWYTSNFRGHKCVNKIWTDPDKIWQSYL